MVIFMDLGYMTVFHFFWDTWVGGDLKSVLVKKILLSDKFRWDFVGKKMWYEAMRIFFPTNVLTMSQTPSHSPSVSAWSQIFLSMCSQKEFNMEESYTREKKVFFMCTLFTSSLYRNRTQNGDL